MKLSKITIRNFRLIQEATLDIDDELTVIVGKNNTAKTSCMTILEKIFKGERLSFDDFPLSKRNTLYENLVCFIKNELKYEDLLAHIENTSVELEVDYSLEGEDDELGALSRFIIDLDSNKTTVFITAEYSLKIGEDALKNILPQDEEDRDSLKNNVKVACEKDFFKHFEFKCCVYSGPSGDSNRSSSIIENSVLNKLFNFFSIHAERPLGESKENKDNSLENLISDFFKKDDIRDGSELEKKISDFKKEAQEYGKNLASIIESSLSDIVQSAIGFGYPNDKELTLGTKSTFEAEEQIKSTAKLTYRYGDNEDLPNGYNGLGYKNLINLEFAIASFARQIKQEEQRSIPILFIEEPESHMHPQMQALFIEFLTNYLADLSDRDIQVILTSHSPRIANNTDFKKIRYAQKTKNGVIYKNFSRFACKDQETSDFIKKYLTISRCDLFFADKIILIEGASERLLIPDMIDKCARENLFGENKQNLSNEYYSISPLLHMTDAS